MHLAIAGPIATTDIAPLLDDGPQGLPRGHAGAPFLGTLLAELVRRGHQVSAFTLSGDLPLRDDAVRVARGPSLALHYVPMRPKAWPPNGRRPGRIVDLFRFERQALERELRAVRPDVVHAHWSYEYAWAALRTGLPHVVTCHDSPFAVARYFRGLTLGGYRWLRAAMAWHVLRHAQRVTTVSPYMVGQIQPLARVPVGLVPNPIAESAFTRRRARLPGRQRVMMVCNGWNALKNGEVALRAFAKLAERLPEAELLACGSGFGPDEEAARWWRQQRLGGRVRFLGAVGHSQVLTGMAFSDVLLHPSLEESFGAVVAEAMAVGLPVVAGESSGAVPWVVGEGGCLVDATSADRLAEAMAALLSEPVRAQALGAAGQTRARALFGAGAVAAAYELEYRHALTGPACAPVSALP